MGFKNFKHGIYVPRSGKCCKTKIAKYRSSYELMFCNLLDDADIVKTWEYESMFVRYYYGSRKRTYIIDFDITLTNGQRFLIEIKPASFYRRAIQLKDMNYFKWEAAKAFADSHNMTFKVLTEVTLPVLARYWKSMNHKNMT